MIKKMWGGRFQQNTHAEVENYTASLFYDVQLLFDDLLGSMAHVEMLKHCGILTPEECHELQHGLRVLAQDAATGSLKMRLEDEDVHMNVERLLYEKVGAVAHKLHTGRSRNDQVALDMHLYVRRVLLQVIEALLNMQTILLDLAKTHSKIWMPGYTHLQRAQPILLGQHWLAYVSMLQRDLSRFQDLWARVNCSPLGAGALAGTHIAIDKNFTAKHLGFDAAYINTLDAVSDRDFVTEFISNAALLMMHLSRMSEELVLWSSQEFSFISIDDAYCTGSSMMPQKKNPDVAELARGKTGRVYGALIALLTVQKALPLAYNKDLQEDKEPLFDVVKTILQTVSIYNGLLPAITVHENRMRNAALDGYLNATALAEYLVTQGIPFRNAHEIVGKLVAHCLDKQCRLEQLSLAEMQQFSPSIQENVYPVLTIGTQDTLKNELQTQCHSFEDNNSKTAQWCQEKQQLLQNVYNYFGIEPFNTYKQMLSLVG